MSGAPIVACPRCGIPSDPAVVDTCHFCQLRELIMYMVSEDPRLKEIGRAFLAEHALKKANL